MALATKNHREQISLDSATRHILEECRMVLPGIQALFGFQLIAVFNDGFSHKLTFLEQKIHLVSILFVTAAVAFVMAPAAFHRQTQPREVSERFLGITSVLLLWGMISLALGICLEIYLVTIVILEQKLVAGFIALIALLILLGLWLGLPRWEKKYDGA